MDEKKIEEEIAQLEEERREIKKKLYEAKEEREKLTKRLLNILRKYWKKAIEKQEATSEKK